MNVPAVQIAAARIPPQRVLLRALRPKQWLKNILLFAAPLAGGALFRYSVVSKSVLAFACFCLVSSAMYLINDLVDAPADRVHPVKKDRPIASGALSARVALATASLLLVVGVSSGWMLGLRFMAAIVVYALVVTAYSLGLKSIAIVDIATVSAGFVLRALAGGFAANVPNSKWFLLLVSLGALFVVSGKRYAEVLRNGGLASTDGARASYTAPYLRFVWIAAATLTIAAYCLWTFTARPNAVTVLVDASTIPFVLAILRYALLVDAGTAGKPEDVFLRDRMLQVMMTAWLLTYGCGVYIASG